MRRLARCVERDTDRLDALVNNAGVAVMGGRRESHDGFELTFAVNYLSHFLLTAELLPMLRASAPSRIVNVASIGQSPVDFDDPMAERGLRGIPGLRPEQAGADHVHVRAGRAAAASAGAGVTVNALHPATLMDTKMVRESFGRAGHAEVAEGVESLTRLVADPELDGVSGRYFDLLEEGAPHPQAYDARGAAAAVGAQRGADRGAVRGVAGLRGALALQLGERRPLRRRSVGPADLLGPACGRAARSSLVPGSAS